MTLDESRASRLCRRFSMKSEDFDIWILISISMSIFDKFKTIFKPKKPKPKPKIEKPPKKPVPKPKKVKVAKKEEIKKPPVKRPPVKKKDLGGVYKTLREPHISEKATVLSEKNKYVFKVYPGVNKIETKKAIENLYGVKVRNVHIINVPKKRRRLGRVEGWRSGYKKAVVTLEKGEKIEILPH